MFIDQNQHNKNGTTTVELQNHKGMSLYKEFTSENLSKAGT